MFESLEEQLKVDAHKSTTSTERTIRWVLGIGIALAVFGALYWGVQMMQGS
jgi:flagellar biogenesis protein FliO